MKCSEARSNANGETTTADSKVLATNMLMEDSLSKLKFKMKKEVDMPLTLT